MTDTLPFLYRGNSMRGTFQHNNLLYVAPVAFEIIRPGDIAVFDVDDSQNGIKTVVHRVLARTRTRLVTKGDNNSGPDSQLVSPEQFVGRVHSVQEGQQVRRVWSGLAGQLWARYVSLWRRLSALGRTPYRWLRASGIVRRLWRPPVTRVMLTTAQGLAVKYLSHSKTVAIWQPETQSFWCRKPYDLVLDSPQPTTNHQRINE